VEKPQNGLAQGFSSLEVMLAQGPQEKKNTSSPEIKKSVDREESIMTKKAASSSKTAPQHQSPPDHQTQNTFSSSSGALEATPSYLQNPQPLYPEEERMRGHEGTVLLRVTINAQGSITHLVIEHSSGYPALDDQAAKTVENSWVFRPAYQHGQAISSRVLIPIHFSLKE
jgi:protein TonB